MSIAIFFSIPFSQPNYDYKKNYLQKNDVNNNSSSQKLSKQPKVSNVGNDPANQSLMKNIEQRTIVDNSTQIFPGVENTYYGSNSLISISNPRTSYGVVSTTIYNDGIKFITNSGIILWEQYIADHPVFASLSSRFSMKIASAAVVEDQNALVVLTKINSNDRNIFYLISYDLGTGQPIYDKTINRQNVPVVSEGGLINNYTQEMSIAYNPLNQTVICYTSGKVSEIKQQLAIFSFDVTNLSKPFNKKTQSTYLNWDFGSAPNNVYNNDYLIDLTIDNETGLIFAMFQKSSGGNNNEKMYMIPFNQNFSSIRRARGAWIPISQNVGWPTNFSPNFVFRKDKNNLNTGMIYGLYNYKQEWDNYMYRYAIEVNTNDVASPSITSNIVVSRSWNYPRSAVLKSDENGNSVGYAYRIGEKLNFELYNYDFLSSEYFNSDLHSNSSWENNNFSFTITSESPEASELKCVVSKPGYFEQWINIPGSYESSVFTPSPLINLNYRSQFLGYSNSGSSIYPSEITNDILQSCSEQSYSPGQNPMPINGNGLWGIFKNNNSFSIVKENMVVSNVIKDDSRGNVIFDISIPYVIGTRKYTNHIKKIKIEGFKSVLSQTALNVSSLDINRYNSVTSINDDGIPFREKRPDLTNMTADEMKSIIISLLVNKPYDIKPENVIIDESTIVSNYETGTLTIPKIALNYYYNNRGILTRGNLVVSNNFILEGFYQGSETSIDTEILYYAPRYLTIKEFINNKNLNKVYLYNIIKNAPIEFNMDTDIEFDKTEGTNVIIDNENGVLTIKELYLLKWNDENGKLHTTRSKPYSIVIKNFINVTTETSVREEYVVYRPNIQPNEITDDQIKEIIKQISLNLPLNFDVSNISFKTEPVRNNLDGTITVQPVFDKWYDNNGFLNNSSKDMQVVTLKGYKAVQPTTFNDSWDIGFYNKYASDFIAEENYVSLKKIIASNIKNLPFFHENSNNNFDYKTDIILEESSIIPNNTEGSIKFNLKLKKYYDQNGIFHNDDSFPLTPVTITGFKRIFGATSFDSLYNIGLTEISPQDFSDQDLKKFLLNNGYNMPVDILEKNINFESVERNPKEGTIVVTPILNIYYDDLGNPLTTPKTFRPITIKGFKQISPTRFDENRWILGTADLVAEEVANDSALLKEILMMKIINVPEGFTANNIEFLSTPFSNNGQGIVNVRVRVTKYYDQNGFLKNDKNSEIFNLTISGFFVAYSRTNIPTSISVNYPDTIAQDISLDKLKEILIDNFTNLPPSFKPENIVLQTSDWEYHNIEGVIVIPSLKINYYFNQSLKLSRDIYAFPTIVISGFQQIQPTQLPLTDWNIGDSKIVASEFVKNDEQVKRLIDSRIINKPSSFNYETDIVLTNLKVANELGAFSVTVNLKKYYDNNGRLSTYGWTPREVIISGFLIVNGATTFSSSIDSLSPTIDASSLTVDEIKNILFNSASNLPPGITPNDIILDMQQDVIVNNVKGEIIANPSLSMWFDNNKELHTTQKTFPEIKIYNFRKVTPTEINNFWDYGDINLTAEEASKNVTSIKNIISNNVMNKPLGFNNDNIEINSISYDNFNGVLIVKFVLNKYYDSNGILQTTGFNEYTARITGYRTISSTIIPTSGWTIGDPTRLASDFLIESNQDFIKELVYSHVLNLPYGYDYLNNIVLSNVVSNNLVGSLSFDLKVKAGYATDGSVDLEGNSSNLNASITILGFKPTFTTVPKETAKISNVADFYPEFFNNNIDMLKSIIFKNRYFLYENLPSSFSEDDIVNVVIENSNNKNGTLSIEVSINNYYSSDNGNLINDKSNLLVSKFLLSGFYHSQHTIFNDETINIQKLNNYLSTEFNGDQENITTKWLEIINEYKDLFFTNLPPNFDINNISEISVLDTNNVDGSCVISASIKGFFADDDLCSIQQSYTNVQFKISGFKILKNTTFNQDLTLRFVNINSISTAANSLLPSDIFNSLSSITINQIVNENYNLFMNNLPEDFTSKNIKNIEMISFDNLQGKLTINITIDKYYSEKGILTTDQPITKTFNISGLKQISPTIHNTNNIISSLSNIVATDLSKDEIVNIVYDNRSIIFNNTLPDCSLDDFKNYFNIINYDSRNYDSTINLNANLSIYYDSDGNLIKDIKNPKTINIVLKGFKQLNNKTTIRKESWLDYNDILISNAILDSTFLPTTIIANKDKIFENIPNDLSPNDFVLSNIKWDNMKGSIKIDIELDKYYDENGVLITKASQNFIPIISQIVLFGFQKIEPTSIGPVSLEKASSSIVIESNIGSAQFLPSHYREIDLVDAETQLYDLVTSKLFAGSINNKINNLITIDNFSFKPETADNKSNSLIVSFDIINFITIEDGLVSKPTSVLLTITGFGGYKEETVSKDTIYYITITAVAYLSVLSSGIIAYIIYKLLRWRKGRI